MARIYDISRKEYDDCFTDKNNKTSSSEYISYRNVICKAMHHLFGSYSKADIKSKFLSLKGAYENNGKLQDNDFVHLYAVQEGNEKIVLFLIDKTKGCFPLMFTPNNQRSFALGAVLKNLHEALDEILNILERYKSNKWSRTLEDELEKYYKYEENEH